MSVVPASAPSVPALAPTPALQLDIDDIALSRLYIGQFMSAAVQNQLVKPGSVFAAAGGDDPDPQVLWTPSEKPKPGVLFHVLSLRKGKSVQVNGELVLFDFDDPDAPPEASVTYNYSLCLPEVDEDLPFKWLLSRTGAPAAKKINTILVKNSISQPTYASAFRVTTAARENAKGKFYIAQVSPVAAKPENIAIAETLDALTAGQPEPVSTRSNQPSI